MWMRDCRHPRSPSFEALRSGTYSRLVDDPACMLTPEEKYGILIPPACDTRQYSLNKRSPEREVSAWRSSFCARAFDTDGQAGI